MKRLVVLTGAGISAESGLQTFRGSDGLWEGYAIEDVATPEAWERNPVLVQRFYNERRKSVMEAQPNAGHLALAKLQSAFDVQIITQNIDDLHERAGSRHVLHLHGLITRSQSSRYPWVTYPIEGTEIEMGQVCEHGSQLRPHVVFFGEPVPMLQNAAEICESADFFAVIGTSLVVYPAASLVDYVPTGIPRYVIDPEIPNIRDASFIHIQETASTGVLKMIDDLFSR